MAINKSYIAAGAACLLIVAWFALNTKGDDRDIYADQAQTEAVVLPTVVVRPVTAERHPVMLTTYGRTLPDRQVMVKAKTAGVVSATPVMEGRDVRTGDLLCRQDVDARQAVVNQAKAAVAKAEADLAATQTLVDRGFKSATQLNADRANLDAVRAQLEQAETELGNIVMRAPFSGIFEERMAEIGDYLSPGQVCGLVVDLDPLKVEAELTETQVGALSEGQEVKIALATGESVTGTINFITARANPATRTFRVEASVPNGGSTLKSGVTAEIDLLLYEADATLVPASILTLAESGETGIRYLDDDNRVQFATVEIIDEVSDGVWVTGLPGRTRVIVEGQDFVAEGAQVEARLESGTVSSRTSPLARTADQR